MVNTLYSPKLGNPSLFVMFPSRSRCFVLQVSYIMADEAGLPLEPEEDPFDNSAAPELKHTNLSAKFLDDARPHMPTDSIR